MLGLLRRNRSGAIKLVALSRPDSDRFVLDPDLPPDPASRTSYAPGEIAQCEVARSN